MSARRRRRARSGSGHAPTELEIMPMINVFMAIIPLLLLSAAFVPVTVIQASLPSDGAAASAEPAEKPLDLRIVLLDDGYVVEGRGVATVTIERERRKSGDESPNPALDQLAEALAAIVAAHPSQKEVQIVSRPNTRYEEVVQVMDVARAAGLSDAALADDGSEA
jgi:biopolymer transport protein ExbD